MSIGIASAAHPELVAHRLRTDWTINDRKLVHNLRFVKTTAVWAHNPRESELTTLTGRSGFVFLVNEMTWVMPLPVVEIIHDNNRFNSASLSCLK